ncbi:MAG: efflux RND transporter permease subunit [Bacteroidales bacterium]
MSNPSRTPAFSILVVALILMIIGAALIPRLPVHLVSTRTRPALTVSFSWSNAPPRLVEQEITAPLEGLLNTIRGVTRIESLSLTGRGSVTLEFDRKADMDAMRFEVASLIRELHPRLPSGCSYPSISAYRQESEEKYLLTYTLNAPATPILIQQYAEEFIKPRLSDIPGLYKIRIWGAMPMEWELEYDQDHLRTLGISRQQIVQALHFWFSREIIGMGFRTGGNPREQSPTPIILRTDRETDRDWQSVPVATAGGRLFRISDLCRVRYREQEPSGYYRINGNNTINLVFVAEKEANSLRVADQVKRSIGELEADFPDGYQLLLAEDSTRFVREELFKIARRTILSFTILLLFVLLVSRQLRYLLVIFISLIANLLISVILYYVFKLEINLYSMAGITVSLGIIIDNTIVMVDHLRTRGNRKVFLAILAATLTTIGALSVIRFLGETTRLQLRDFSYVLIASLFVSLAVALFLVPSLMELIGMNRKRKGRKLRNRRRIVAFSRFYERFIRFEQRFRWAFILLAILLFGLPVNKLPTRMEGEAWYHRLYRSTLASESYVQKIKPVLDKVLGGTLRIFSTKVYERYQYRTPERTAIMVRAALPQGATLMQMNDLMVEVERYLSGYEQIDQFRTSITSYRSGTVNITFKPEYEQGAFPYILYSQLNDLANKNTGADWSVQGVGQYFSNSLSESVGQWQIELFGYHYEDLMAYAEMVRNRVLEHPRAGKAYIMSERSWQRDPLFQYVISMDPETLRMKNLTPAGIYAWLEGYSIRQSPETHIFANQATEPVRFRSTQSDRFDIWMMGNTPINPDEAMISLTSLGHLQKEGVNKSIAKEDQQYRLIVEYEFNGASKLAQMHRQAVVDEMTPRLAVGYSIRETSYRYWQREANRQFFLILMVIAIIYFITAILLESLTQPLAVVLIIPVSFVGVFLTFFLFNLSFDQGGFASFVLLSGIVVNAALYILNDFNQFARTAARGVPLGRLYLKAFNGKIVPITLTVLSTVLGLVPFIAEGQDEVFWFALAAGTMGGLLFSVLAILVFLPAFLPLKKRRGRLGNERITF